MRRRARSDAPDLPAMTAVSSCTPVRHKTPGEDSIASVNELIVAPVALWRLLTALCLLVLVCGCRSKMFLGIVAAQLQTEVHEPPRGERAHGYEKLAGFSTDVYGWTAEEGSGDSGIVSTAVDLAVFVRAVTGTNSFLNEATRKLLKSQPSTSPTDRPWYPIIHYDFGVTAEREAGKDVPVAVAPWFFGHGGATAG